MTERMKSRSKRSGLKNDLITVKLRVVLKRPPGNVDFGLQEGHGSAYQVVQKKRSIGDDLEFAFTVTVKPSRNGSPDFAGPFVQGPAGDRFVYVDIGTYAGQTNTEWSRRLKIPLNRISWDLIDSGKVLKANIPGTGKDGGPSCAYEWRRRVGPSWQWQ